MSVPFICGGNKYKTSPTNTLALPIVLPDLPKEVTINNNKLVLKSSFHVSLVCINEIIRKHNIKNPNFKDLVLEDFCEFTKEHDIEILEFTNDYKFVEQNDWKTVVAMCRMSNLNNFFDHLNKKYNLNLEYPPTHVTLYINEGGQGIFLTDQEDINNLTKPIDNPLGTNL